MSDSVQPHRRQPTRLLHPWDSPGKNTGVGCHFLLQCMKVKSCVRLFVTHGAHQAPLSVEFSKQDYWSGLPCPSSAVFICTHKLYTSICYLYHATVNLKNAQCEDFKLSFIWGKMSIAAQETAPHIALRNCSKEVRGRDSIYVILVKAEFMQSSIYFG